MFEEQDRSFQLKVMHGIHTPIAKTKTMNPDKPVQFDYEYHAKVCHRTGKPLYDHINTIVVRLSTPIAPELGNKIAVSKRTVKQAGHWCFPAIHTRRKTDSPAMIRNGEYR